MTWAVYPGGSTTFDDAFAAEQFVAPPSTHGHGQDSA